ncbi:diguanylate cyclase [uncultured Roseobacter sp.]|uniref:diguanylate cyclase domain-containing protein n=1 Tax=uncultured Roseobacter sp. TaxID=114847 RepID=UPI002621938E|nr:diguanylate cyclase [uncultured Roseobacter sp.]
MASRRQIFILLFFMGLFSACVILGLLFWMTAQLEQTEHDKTRALIRLKLTEASDALTLAVEDYAYWTLAHQIVRDRDDAAVSEHMGSGAFDSPLFDQLFILAPDGTLAYAFDETLGAAGHRLYDQGALAPVQAALNQTDPADYLSVSAFVNLNGKLSAVTAAWITPDAIEEMPDLEPAVLYGVVHLGVADFDALIESAGITSMTFAPYPGQREAPVNRDSLMVNGQDGAPVALISWEIRSLGLRLRERLLPGFLLIAASLIGICGIAARYFHLQYIALGEARRIAATDQLTGALNRAGLVEEINSNSLQRSLKQGQLAAIYLDLNGLKALNDTLGHDAGDLALRITAQRLQSAAAPSDIVARLGGDEFVCVTTGPAPEDAARRIAERVLTLAREPVPFKGTTITVAPSVGLAVSRPGATLEAVLAQADAAMYRAKQQNADYPVLFTKPMDVNMRRRASDTEPQGSATRPADGVT